jgi:phenylacetate-CoA ligase
MVPPVEPAPARVGSFESSDGLRLAYEEHGGEGPLYVFVPGLGFSREYFRPLAGMVASWGRCVLLDNRGAGESEPPASDDGFALERHVEDLLGLLKHLDAGPAHLVGHSFGANVVIGAARAQPDAAGALTLISPALSAALVQPSLDGVLAGADEGLRAIVRRVEDAGPAMASGTLPAEYARATAEIYQDHVLRTPISNSLATAMRQSDAAVAALWGRESAFRITGMMARFDQQDDVASLDLPVMVVTGEGDAYCAPTLAILRERLPRGTFLELDQSLHHAHIEEPARIADAMWVRSAPAGARLRFDVTLSEEGEDFVLEDEATGFRYLMGDAAAELARSLDGRPVSAVVESFLAEAGDEYDEEDAAEAIEDFVAELMSCGLLAEGLSQRAIRARQRDARRATREEERFAAVQEAIADAVRRVPFHRDRFQELGLDPDELTSPEDLRRLPVMTKVDIRKNFPDRLVPDDLDVKQLLADGTLSVGATSGTTDERLQVLFDFAAGGLPEHYEDFWALEEGVGRGAVFTSPLCAGFECHLGMTTREERTRGATLTLNSSDDVMSISDEEVQAIAREMNEFEPQVLFVNPWYGVWFLRRVAALGLTLPPLAAVLPSYQYLTRRHRKLLSEGFGAPVFSYYGATDLGGALIGAECAEGSMHVREDHVYVEVVPLEDDPSVGKLLVTTLNNPYMPLIRYEVGDVAAVDVARCSCLRDAEWEPLRLEGRAKDLLHDASGGVVTTRRVDDAIGEDDVDFYRLRQTGDRSYQLEAMPAEGGDLDAVTERLRAVLGADAEVRVREVRRFSPERSLKFRQTVDERR